MSLGNRTIWNHLNDYLKSLGFPGLVNFMPYNIHAVCNDFKHVLSEYGQLAEQLGTPSPQKQLFQDADKRWL